MITKGFFDGCCEPRNPGGSMGFGAYILRGDKEIFNYSDYRAASPENTNNVSEYLACESLLDFILNNRDYLKKYGCNVISIFGDSKLVISQMFGFWKIKQGLYTSHAIRCKEKLENVRGFGFVVSGKWIPREENYRADDLSKTELVTRGIELSIWPRKAA